MATTIKDDDLISVRNRINGETWYQLDNGVVRTFARGETKKVPYKELVELSYSVGGRSLLEENLVIENKDALDLLNMAVEPEYFYTEEKIREILFDASPNCIDKFADFLDFAPEGALGIAKDIAVNEQIPDNRKREMLSKRTGLSINEAINLNKIMEEESDNKDAEAPKQRRVQVEEAKPEIKQRRTEVPAPKIIIKK